MTTDPQTQSNVLEELAWEPDLLVQDIGVDVRQGQVMLSGHVPDYDQKWHACQAALRAFGALGVHNYIEVCLPAAQERTDAQLERSVKAALKWLHQLTSAKVRIAVDHGEVILDGSLRWEFEKQAATRSVRTLVGVKDLHNEISVSYEAQTTHPYAIGTLAGGVAQGLSMRSMPTHYAARAAAAP
jgi:osmotically-inducible protein OsmY